MEQKIGIGSTVWVFDINRRKYTKPEGGGFGSIIWREHWGPHTIVAETSRSWVLDRIDGRKIPKRGADPRFVAFSEEAVGEQDWFSNHRYKIEAAVGRIQDAALLRKIADLIGYRGDKS